MFEDGSFNFWFLYVLFLGHSFIFIRYMKTNTRMHQAHSKVINLIFDQMIEDKKKQISAHMQAYAQFTKGVTKH